MAFQEKSAWIMIVALTVSGAFYVVAVAMMSSAGELAPPVLPVLVVYTIAQTVMAIIGHICISVFAPKEANARIDEREKLIGHRAAHWSGTVLGVGVVFSLIAYLFSYDGNILFYAIFASLILSQVLEYVLRIVFYRRGVF
ncbi:MAG: hypothetical protein AAF438_05785 [Pseudomonadota bacterium]